MIITMTKNLEMTVIAKGVEFETQVDCLKKMGCNEFQGYLLGRPMPIDDYASLFFQLGEQTLQIFNESR
jgi:EAL domain-containing protein (putative c-di-GMP-specific phosphodiesterase class I)